MVNRKNRGSFIVIEGIDGSGKTTQAKMLYEKLEQVGVKVKFEREPTDYPIGKLCRDITMGNTCYNMKDLPTRTLSMLFAADRYDHIMNNTHGMNQYLNNGVNIVCDRYYLSNIVYQSYSYYYSDENWQRMMDVVNVNNCNHQELAPDVIFYINTPPEVAINRVQSRNEEQSIYEDNIAKLTQIYNTYEKAIDLLRRTWNENIIEINGEDDIGKIHQTIYHHVYPIVNKK